MKHRRFNKIYAKVFGYFWIPCPICGQMFGGHEWKSYDGMSSAIRTGKPGINKGICKDCTLKGLGDKPDYIFLNDAISMEIKEKAVWQLLTE